MVGRGGAFIGFLGQPDIDMIGDHHNSMKAAGGSPPPRGGGVKVDGFAGQLDHGITKDMVYMDRGFPSPRGGVGGGQNCKM